MIEIYQDASCYCVLLRDIFFLLRGMLFTQKMATKYLSYDCLTKRLGVGGGGSISELVPLIFNNMLVAPDRSLAAQCVHGAHEGLVRFPISIWCGGRASQVSRPGEPGSSIFPNLCLPSSE